MTSPPDPAAMYTAMAGTDPGLPTWDQLDDVTRQQFTDAILGASGMQTDKPTAQLAYEAYAAEVGGVNVRGEPLPTWDGLVTAELGSRIQDGWHAAVNAVQRAHYAAQPAPDPAPDPVPVEGP